MSRHYIFLTFALGKIADGFVDPPRVFKTTKLRIFNAKFDANC